MDRQDAVGVPTRFDPKRLRMALARRGLTVRTLAAAASVSPATVVAALHGRPLSLRSIVAISRGLAAAEEIPFQELLAG